MEKLDSICMQLIAVGESLKHLDKITDRQLLGRYPAIDWKGAKGIRDIIAHHDFDIDAKRSISSLKADFPIFTARFFE